MTQSLKKFHCFFLEFGHSNNNPQKKKHEKRSLTLNDNMSTSGYPGAGFLQQLRHPAPERNQGLVKELRSSVKTPGNFGSETPKGTWTASVCCLQPMATTTVNNGQQPTPPRKNKTLHRCTEQRASCKNWGSSRPGTKKSFASAHAILSEEILLNSWPAGRFEEDQKPSS